MVVEDGSDAAAELWNGEARTAASILTYAEACAALAAARRSGRLDASAHARALTEFEDLNAELISLGVDADLARSAGRLAEDLELRGCEAVHLATALALGDETVLVTWDTDLQRAAERAGLAVAGA